MPGREELVAPNLPDYPSPERAVAALKAMCDYAAWRQRPPRVVTRFPVNRRRVERDHLPAVAHGPAPGRRSQGQGDPPSVRLRSAGRALADHAWTRPSRSPPRIGFPVAMKIVSPDIIHKSDMGGVKLNLNSAQEVRDAFELMMLRIGRSAPEAGWKASTWRRWCREGARSSWA